MNNEKILTKKNHKTFTDLSTNNNFSSQKKKENISTLPTEEFIKQTSSNFDDFEVISKYDIIDSENNFEILNFKNLNEKNKDAKNQHKKHPSHPLESSNINNISNKIPENKKNSDEITPRKTNKKSYKINLINETIILNYKLDLIKDERNSFSNSFYNFKNFLKFNVFPLNKVAKLNELNYIRLFNKTFPKEKLNSKEFKNEIKKIFNITYRTHIPSLVNEKTMDVFNTDCGWGCMIRSCQMIISKAILEYKIFKTTSFSTIDKFESLLILKNNVISLFFDNIIDKDEINFLDPIDFSYYFKNKNNLLTEEKTKFKDSKFINKKTLSIEGLYAPFSIHNICKIGSVYNAGAGIWFSDPKAIKVIKEIKEQLNIFESIEIFANDSGVIKEKDILDKCFTEKILECSEFCRNRYNINDLTNKKSQCSITEYYSEEVDEFYKDHPKYKLNKENKKKYPDINENTYIKNDYEIINHPKDNRENKLTEKLICEECLKKMKISVKNFSEILYEVEIESGPGVKTKRKFYEFIKTGFIFLSVRLGINEISEEYYDTIKKFFEIPHNLGIIGGKNNSAHYFFGESDGKLIYLDPHYSQKSVEKIKDLYDRGYESYEAKNLFILDIKYMSPCFTMGFHFRNLKEFIELKYALEKYS